jgi:5-methylcytosine-specific restriction endonuclease McrA
MTAEMKRLRSQLDKVEAYGVMYQESTNSFIYANNKDRVYHYSFSLDELAAKSAFGTETKVCAFLKKSYVSSLFDDEWYRSFINENLNFAIHSMSSDPSLYKDDLNFRKGLVHASNRTLERLNHLKQKVKDCKAEKKTGGSESVRMKTEAPPTTDGTARKKMSTTESCALKTDCKPSASNPKLKKKDASAKVASNPKLKKKDASAKVASKSEVVKENLARKKAVPKLLRDEDPKLKKRDASAKVASKSEVVKENLGRKKAVPKSVRDEVWRRFGGGTSTTSVCQVCEISTISYLCGSGSKAVLGHVQSHSLGGTGEVDNLRPICANCNSTMGTQNMFAFKASKFPNSSPASWMQLHGVLIH